MPLAVSPRDKRAAALRQEPYKDAPKCLGMVGSGNPDTISQMLAAH